VTPGITLAALAEQLSSGRTTSRALTEAALSRIEAKDGEGPRAFVRVFREAALAAADASDRLRKAGVVPSPVAGIPVSVKDLTDVAGVTTLAGSGSRKNDPPAKQDATVLARLRAAGAVVVGTTNMTEFALGGLGINPHFGDCRNPWDRATGRIPGGSSSGAAVSVSDGMAYAGLGTDTMGSVRIPAALCGITGFKPTAVRVPREGIFPLSTTLDSVGPLANSVECCALIDAIFAGERPRKPEPLPLRGLRLGVPTTLMLDNLDPEVAKAFGAALRKLSAAGARIEEFAFPEIAEVADLNKRCGFSIVESYPLHRKWIAIRSEGYDPRILARMLLGKGIDAADYYDALQLRAELVTKSAKTTARFDAVVMPTLPVIAPPISRFLATDEGRKDGFPILIRNTCVANYLDRCALTVPCQEPGTAPVGFTVMGERMGDRKTLEIGSSVFAALSLT
jgi:aspartyl-tRNA(Asn)/glutamyl-tRNA(Gln) amidotransferase subunit A